MTRHGAVRAVVLVWGALLLGCTPTGSEAADPTASANPKAKFARFEGPFVVYEVRDGDSLGVIAERYDIRGGAPAIAEANGIPDSNVVRAGRGLLLPITPQTASLPRYQPLRSGAPTMQPCATTVAPEATEHAVAGCSTAICTTLDSNTICLCRPDSDGPRQIVITGNTSARWPIPGEPGVARLVVAGADLDADGDDELVIAAHASTSNGICVDTTEVAVLAPDQAVPLTFSSAGFGVDTSIVELEGRCKIVVGSVEPATEPILGPGNYTLNRPFIYASGALEPDFDAPIWGERIGGEGVVQWDREPVPRVLTRGEDASADRRARIAGTAVHAGEYATRVLQLDVLAGTRSIKLLSDRPLGSDEDPIHQVTELWRNGRKLPAAYVPQDPTTMHGLWVVMREEERGPGWILML